MLSPVGLKSDLHYSSLCLCHGSPRAGVDRVSSCQRLDWWRTRITLRNLSENLRDLVVAQRSSRPRQVMKRAGPVGADDGARAIMTLKRCLLRFSGMRFLTHFFLVSAALANFEKGSTLILLVVPSLQILSAAHVVAYNRHPAAIGHGCGNRKRQSTNHDGGLRGARFRHYQ